MMKLFRLLEKAWESLFLEDLGLEDALGGAREWNVLVCKAGRAEGI